MKIGILCIATNRYKEFIQPLIESIEANFLTAHDVTIHLFTDDLIQLKTGLKVEQTIIPSYKFPEATLYRYRIFLQKDYADDYLFYLDADMRVVAAIGDEVLNDITCVRHPGYYRGGGSWETREDSSCFVAQQDRLKYFAGGFAGGKTDVYLPACQVMSQWIDTDLSNGIMPIWHDESAWNKYLVLHKHVELTPSYCMPEARGKREYCKVGDLPAKILALEKNFNYFRG